MDSSKKTYVLVHGAWHGAWYFQTTKQKMEQSGSKVIAFDLPGHGNDKTDISQVSLDSYVERVKQEITKLDTSVILVGHSLAGFIISKVAEEMPDKVEKLVFVAAMIPNNGKSVLDILKADTGSELLNNLIFSEDQSWATVSEDTLKKVVYNGATDEQIAEAAPQLVRQATQPFSSLVTTTENNFGKIPKVYIGCTMDKILSENAQKELSKMVGCSYHSISLNTGHVPQIESPIQLAEALLNA
ncbi:alpha/beta fold hydrolase [Galbibacter sp. EGI 63066]|uniref:alpha/beta fold hydrolase n=1 Tax=Galbibacter sp. EGI 63066 TaxID=2993559 RepID=UPI002248EA05|nr:alpha/beta fold hydrolase [Galbibacter sp. EGI 63066]MCX2679013.1 alpha/beta fold hydrolase [Galbibacter sp. EGI 63066]